MADCTLAEDAGQVGPLTVNLGLDCIWENKFQYTSINQGVRKTIDSSTIVEIVKSGSSSGIEISLECGWHPMTVVEDLVTIRDRLNQMPLTLTLCDGDVFVGHLDHEKGLPIEIVPILSRPDYIIQPTPDWFAIKIHFVVGTQTVVTWM